MFLKLSMVNEKHGTYRRNPNRFAQAVFLLPISPICISVIACLSTLCTAKLIAAHSVPSTKLNSKFLSDSSEAPRVTFILTEETKSGTRIGNVLQGLRAINTQTANFNPTGSVNLLELKSNKYLRLNGTNGDLFVQARIDRESLCREIGTCCATTLQKIGLNDSPERVLGHFQSVHNSKSSQPVFLNCFLRMLVLQNPNSDQFVEIIVYILDVNDNAPRWSQQVLDLEIPEHVPIGSMYKLPEATDPDQGPTNTVVAYHLFPASYNPQTSQVTCIQCPDRDLLPAFMSHTSGLNHASNIFSLDSQLIDGSNFVKHRFNLNLRVENDLDREKQATHYLILYAIDGTEEFGQHQSWSMRAGDFPYPTRHTGTLTIKITVLDTNDQAPVFVDTKPRVTVAENTKPGTVIYQSVARDADLVDKNNLIYKISSSATAEVHRCFAINQSTGEVYIRNRLYFPNATVLTDSGQKSTGQFRPSLGYVIPLQVSDRLHQAEATLTVQLIQVNSQPPKISLSSHLRMSTTGDQLWISEDTPVDSIVAMINLNDPDKPISMGNSDEDFLSSGNPTATTIASGNRPQCFTNHDHFIIRPLLANAVTEFKLILRKPLDREISDSHTLRIECWDAGSPPLSSDIRLFVHVDDIDDSAPKFEKPVYLVSVREGQPPHTLIARVQATDADVGRNADLVYRIVNLVYTHTRDGVVKPESTPTALSEEKTFISIDQNTGEIFNELIFDRETLVTINCTVEAVSPHAQVESGQVGAAIGSRFTLKAQTYVVINIEDVNDCAPQFNMTAYEFAVFEGQQPHHQIGRIFAVDNDAEAPNNLIRYSMRPIPGPIGQLAKLYLAISSDGIIYTQQTQLDREQTPVLSFEVVATDSGRPSMSAFANVLVRVLDTNDNSPVWLFPKQYGTRTTVNISQQATVGFQLAQLKAIDLDDGANGELVYSILHGNEDGFFEVDPLNGALYLAKPLHRFAYNESMPFSVDVPAPRITNRSQHSDEKQPTYSQSVVSTKFKANFYQHRLILKASDRGQPPRFNTTVLNILIIPSDINDITEMGMRGDRDGNPNNRYGNLATHEFSRILDQDLVIMVVLIALTSVISLILILAICLIRCRQLAGTRRSQRTVLCGPNTNNGGTKGNVLPNREKQNWWKPNLAFLNRGDKQTSGMDQPEFCNRGSVQDLYVMSSTVCEEDLRQQEQLHDITGHNTPGPDAYFTICPGTWNTRTGPKGTCSTILDPETYIGLANTTDKLSNTYVVEINPSAFDQSYALIKSQPCTSNIHDNVQYQTLYPDRAVIKKHSPIHMNQCSLKRSYPAETAGHKIDRKTVDVEMQEMKQEQQLLVPYPDSDGQRSPCRRCDQQFLQTFLRKTPTPANVNEREQNVSKNDDREEEEEEEELHC